jgi:hypothetical protein
LEHRNRLPIQRIPCDPFSGSYEKEIGRSLPIKL